MSAGLILVLVLSMFIYLGIIVATFLCMNPDLLVFGGLMFLAYYSVDIINGLRELRDRWRRSDFREHWCHVRVRWQLWWRKFKS